MSTDPARFELLRALGACSRLRGAERRRVEEAIGLDAASEEEHTEVFVLECPPYASLHLGPEGKLGGEAADRVAGFYRAVGLVAPRAPDHLAVLLDAYATLGSRAELAPGGDERAFLRRARAALLSEHLLPWLPGYLDAVRSLRAPTAAVWADLLADAVDAEVGALEPPGRLALALRAAPPVDRDPPGRDEILDLATAPLRSGFVLTRAALRRVAARVGAGLRAGERRYALASLLDQEPAGVLACLSQEAARWGEAHRSRARFAEAVDPAAWWARRALEVAARLEVAGPALAAC